MADVEESVIACIGDAIVGVNGEIGRHDVVIVPAPTHPKHLAEYSVQHVSDKHPVGFVRFFSFQARKDGSFSVVVQVHLDEEDKVLQFEERSVDDFKKHLADFVQGIVEEWAK